MSREGSECRKMCDLVMHCGDGRAVSDAGPEITKHSSHPECQREEEKLRESERTHSESDANRLPEGRVLGKPTSGDPSCMLGLVSFQSPHNENLKWRGRQLSSTLHFRADYDSPPSLEAPLTSASGQRDSEAC